MPLLEEIKEAVHEVDHVEGLPAVSPVNEGVLHAVREQGVSVNDVADRHAEIAEDVCPLRPESLLQIPCMCYGGGSGGGGEWR